MKFFIALLFGSSDGLVAGELFENKVLIKLIDSDFSLTKQIYSDIQRLNNKFCFFIAALNH